ncbi:nuclear envelope pore membrane protein POM 121C-like isoform X2 [Pteropus medius]|uniref:nuclear envelope pore membrane protein POM 121C-like isoform X2 n=1 Tax=Pteropus vampyrus TaxID=132908 RepID=UPI00196AF035|nr:nuclear envelope pore membrane protein POM 121C-like isoform X2 [Pteropus giganteus]
MVCSPVTVRIAPPDRKLTRLPMSKQLISSTLSSPSSDAPDPCAKETILSALKERKKRTVKEEEQIFTDSQENKRRCHDSRGSGPSVFESLVADRVPASFVPNLGSLKRGLNSQSSDDQLNKRSLISSMSSMTSRYAGGLPSSSRNAITSSYSSTRGFSQLWKTGGPNSPPFPSPDSFHSRTPKTLERKIKEEFFHHSSSSIQLVTDKESGGEKAADTTTWKKENSWNSPCTLSSSGQRKRKIQLLPSRRGDQLTLPSPPQLGYSITAKDLDFEKKALLQWFNKVLESKTESAGVATTVAQMPPKISSLLGPLGSSQTVPLPGTSSDTKSAVTFLGSTPASSGIPVTDTTKSLLVPQAETSAKSQALSAPLPTPKQGVLFGMLRTPPANPSAAAAPAVSSAPSMFKPIFMVPPKNDNEGPLLASPSKVTTSSSSSALPSTNSPSLITFKPIFGSMGPPTSVPLSTPFFNQTTTPATTTGTDLFTGQVSATSAVAAMTISNNSADSTLKPAFSFDVSSVTSTMSSVTSTTTSTSKPFLFGTFPASGASFTPAMGSIFQSGKPPAMPTSTTVTTFGQSLPSAMQTGTSSSATSFDGFGSTFTASVLVTTNQPKLTFSSTATSASNIPFASSTKTPLSSYPGTNPQLSFGQQQGATKPAITPSFGSSFTFGNSAAPAPTATPAPAPAQPAFGRTVQSAFGVLKLTASAFSTPASTQTAFGSTTAVFSFGSANTSGSGATTQTTSSGTSSSVFDSTTPLTFTIRGSAAQAGNRSFGISMVTPSTTSTSGAFSFAGGQDGMTSNTIPFGGGLSQNTLDMPSQSTPFAFSASSTPESKPVFGGTSTPIFGRSSPAPRVGTSGSNLSFAASSTPNKGFIGDGPLGSATPSFSIGAGSRTPGAGQRQQARRQHTRKK